MVTVLPSLCQLGNLLQPSAGWQQRSPPHTPPSPCAAPPPEPRTSGAAPGRTHTPRSGRRQTADRRGYLGGRWHLPGAARSGLHRGHTAAPPCPQELFAQAQPEAIREVRHRPAALQPPPRCCRHLQRPPHPALSTSRARPRRGGHASRRRWEM